VAAKSKKRKGTHLKANAPSQRGARQEAAKLAARNAPIDFHKLALTINHANAEGTLRVPAEPVEEITEYVRSICARMTDVTRRDAGCAGMAAPQVGVSWRIIAVKDNDGMVYCFINPTVTPREGAFLVPEHEGCYSIPNRRFRVKRWSAVVVEGQAPFGPDFRHEFTGTAARAAQHEMDHLEGILVDQLEQVPDEG
jgi:peptide deformylase